jgi:DUF1680 family protein
MRGQPLLAVSAPFLVLACSTQQAPQQPAASGPRVVAQQQPTGAARNMLHASNQPPLQPNPLTKLPLGAVRPAGWLQEQLRLQNAGFHGHLTQISKFLKKDGNAWLSPTGEGDHGWEEVPYWLKGFLDCAYLLGDEAQIAEAKVWIEGALASQREDGYFGPRSAKSTVSSTAGKYDLWPNMVMLSCLQSYYEATGDARVIELMRRYFRWQLTVPEAEFLPPYWQQQRGGDNLWSVYWFYNRTGEAWVLELADKIHRHTANWTAGVPDWHNVNMTQAFGSPAFHAMQSGNADELAAPERNWQAIRARFGQVPGGLFGGDENCRVGFADPRQAIESCGMVEAMFTCERLLQVTGDAIWADRCEDVAFNSLPAAMTADLRALRYLTAPNQPLADGAEKAPGIENGGPMFLMNPWLHRCCQHNVGHGWPYFVEHLWMAAPDDGLAAPLYAPCEVTTKVRGGNTVRIVETTRYPFRETIEFDVETADSVAFPLFLRVPGWCAEPSLAIDGSAVPVAARAGGWLRLDHTFRRGTTRITLRLPMAVTVRHWPQNQGSVSIERGPLTYSLAIGEAAERAGGTDEWPAHALRPTTPWNYGLELPTTQAPIEVRERPWPAHDRPWTPTGAPIELRARGARIDNWQLDPTGLVQKLQPSPVRSDAPREDLRLLPMGAQRLRISSFPVLGSGADAQPWRQAPESWSWQIAASHCFRYDTLHALRDGEVPPDPAPARFPRFSWWDRQGSVETVQYEFPAARQVAKVQVYWFHDQPGGGCALPASWVVLTKDGDRWQPVEAAGPYGTGSGGFQTVEFTPVTTTGIRLQVQLQQGKSGGIYEWRVE